MSEEQVMILKSLFNELILESSVKRNAAYDKYDYDMVCFHEGEKLAFENFNLFLSKLCKND